MLVERRFPLPGVPGLDREPPAVPVPARSAATVTLVRPAGAGLEVFMLHRVSSMAFAPGRWVFPGGGVDPRDADVELPWAGPEPAEWAQRVDCDEDRARGLVVAAARELFEECGVLLAGPSADTVVTDVTGPEWDEARSRLVAREMPFAGLLAERGLVLRTDLLVPHARWITPAAEPRRYDTAFFAARVPDGQQPDDRTTEAEQARWRCPGEVLEDAAHGRAQLLPPTTVALERIAAASDAAAFVAQAPAYVAVEPERATDPDGTPYLMARIPT